MSQEFEWKACPRCESASPYKTSNSVHHNGKCMRHEKTDSIPQEEKDIFIEVTKLLTRAKLDVQTLQMFRSWLDIQIDLAKMREPLHYGDSAT